MIGESELRRMVARSLRDARELVSNRPGDEGPKRAKRFRGEGIVSLDIRSAGMEICAVRILLKNRIRGMMKGALGRR